MNKVKGNHMGTHFLPLQVLVELLPEQTILDETPVRCDGGRTWLDVSLLLFDGDAVMRFILEASTETL